MISLRAVVGRELEAAVLNRYLQVFTLLAIGGGLAAAFISATPAAAPMLILQIALYFVSLFALLIGTSSARAEREEWPLLFAQPISRSTFFLGKTIALTLLFAALLALLFLPALFVRPHASELAFLYSHSLLLAVVFLSLGLSIGFLARERVQGLVIGLSAWLLLLVGVDLGAFLLAQTNLLQRWPDIWSGLLMLNPLDSFRINGLFSLEKIPAESIGETSLTNWWVTHPGLWFLLIGVVWVAALLTLTARVVRRWEE